MGARYPYFIDAFLVAQAPSTASGPPFHAPTVIFPSPFGSEKSGTCRRKPAKKAPVPFSCFPPLGWRPHCATALGNKMGCGGGFCDSKGPQSPFILFPFMNVFGRPRTLFSKRVPRGVPRGVPKIFQDSKKPVCGCTRAVLVLPQRSMLPASGASPFALFTTYLES